MFGLGGLEIVVIFVVALIVLGPEKLPQVAQKLARLLGEVRRVTDQVKREVEDAASEGSAERGPEDKLPAASKVLARKDDKDRLPEMEES